jgi:hypothetical protein
MAVSQLRPISAQGDLVSRRADPPSQDRRSLGYLVSSPPLATDHGSRLHQLSGGAACRLSASHHLDMTRPQRIAVTAFLSALFVPSLFPLLMGLSAPGNAKGDRRLGQKKTLESWLQGRLPFIRESLGSSVTRPPPMTDRSTGGFCRWAQLTPLCCAPIPLLGDNDSQVQTGPHLIAINWT